jgi:hypothetical protein
MKRKSSPLRKHPIEILRRSLGLSYSDFALQLGLKMRGDALCRIIKSRRGLSLIPLIQERWGADITDKIIFHMDQFFSELKPVPLEDWAEKEREAQREKEYYPPARSPYKPLSDLNEMVRTIGSVKL